jgi:pre-mRNA-processing factor 6
VNGCCRNAPLLMEWALLEAEAGQAAAARELFSQGAQAGRAGAPHAPLFAAWADFEEQQGRWGC